MKDNITKLEAFELGFTLGRFAHRLGSNGDIHDGRDLARLFARGDNLTTDGYPALMLVPMEIVDEEKIGWIASADAAFTKLLKRIRKELYG